MDPPPPKSWSIHTRPEIIKKYEILERVGSGAYSDVYRARRLSDDLIVALKEVHDYQSAFREIESLQILRNSPNVVVLHEYFWREDEDAVLVLEFLRTDLACVVKEAKKRDCGIAVGEIKRWMIQILSGVDTCHRNMIVHRDLKPGNLLISDDGVLKLADFGQARILQESGYIASGENPQAYEENALDEVDAMQQYDIAPDADTMSQEGFRNQEHVMMSKEEYFQVLDELKSKTNVQDGNTSCLATCTTSDREDDPFKSSALFEAEEVGDDRQGSLTSCVGTRWFRAPELLYGSTSYGLEIDLWSLGCIIAELFTLQPLFPGISDIDQLSRIMSVLGNLNEESWPGCVRLPDYRTISFNKVETPIGLEACLLNRSSEEISLVKKLVCYDPSRRATAMELFNENYFNEEPLPVPISQLHVPSTRSGQDDDSRGECFDYNEMDSDSDFDFGPMDVTTTGKGFSIQFL